MEPETAQSRSITAFGSGGVAMTRCFWGEAVSVQHATFAPGAILGRHPATRGQSFTVVSGSGWVSGSDGCRHSIVAGQTVTWHSGESHESGSDTGMSAVIVEH